ncbi:MAG: hypothetical protein J1F42_14250 [Lachnospiraceae bacterium]|nr:hypothetical protein [Lachnospiraceae bacterium]
MNIRGLTVICICVFMVFAAIWGVEEYLQHRNYVQLDGDISDKRVETSIYERCIEYNGKPNKEMIGTITNSPELQYWVVYYDDMIVSYNYSEEYGIGHGFQAMFWTDDYFFGKNMYPLV